jgi:hypothetical protein
MKSRRLNEPERLYHLSFRAAVEMASWSNADAASYFGNSLPPLLLREVLAGGRALRQLRMRAVEERRFDTCCCLVLLFAQILSVICLLGITLFFLLC